MLPVPNVVHLLWRVRVWTLYESVLMRCVFRCIGKVARSMLASSCLPTSKLPAGGFSWNVVFESFIKIVEKIQVWFKQKMWGTLHEDLSTIYMVKWHMAHQYKRTHCSFHGNTFSIVYCLTVTYIYTHVSNTKATECLVSMSKMDMRMDHNVMVYIHCIPCLYV